MEPTEQQMLETIKDAIDRNKIVVFMKGTPAAPYPLATRGHFYEDEELERLPREAGFTYSRVTRPDTGAQLLVARG